MASTATTAPSFTATDWPMSSAAIASAMRYPNCDVGLLVGRQAAAVNVPARAMSGRSSSVESMS